MLELSPDQLALVRGILAAHAPDCEVFAFGSRVTGRAAPASDLDLAVRGAARLRIGRIAALKEAFEESTLPFRVDLVDWNAVTPEFRAVIEARCEPIRSPA